MESKKQQLGQIICGFSGVGKTTLGKKYQNVAEIGQSLYRFIFTDPNAYTMDRELRKNIKEGKIPNPEWPMNYINKIQELRQEYDLVLVFTDPTLMEYFEKLKIPFWIALPDKSRKEEFLNNFRKRGQDENFIIRADREWDRRIEQFMKRKEKKILLKKGEYLEDALIEQGFILK